MHGSRALGRGSASWRWGCQAGAVALALAVTGVASASQAGASFNVTVNLQTTPNGGTCETTPESPARPSVVSIDCHSKPLEPAAAPRTPVPPRDGQAFRFMIPNGSGEQRFGAVDLYAGAGTITSWRVVHLTDWDYLEMTVGW